MWDLRGQKNGTQVGQPLETQRALCEAALWHHFEATGAPTRFGTAWFRCNDIIPAASAPYVRRRRTAHATPLATDKELTDFLKSVEKRAFKRTVYTMRDEEGALDIVQDSMIRLAEKYADRPAAELPLLFQRILSNATMDWFRRQKVRGAVMQSFSDFEGPDHDGDFDLLETLEALDGSTATESSADSVSRAQILQVIEGEVGKLPARQREAFLMRYWEELDVAETAAAMGCSEGSVKTHCSRAVHSLAKALRAKGITL
jgi:RNA polymerase sigma-70 factor (ECF subfamily)